MARIGSPDADDHAPVFVLAHRPGAAFELEGGTSFPFVADGIKATLTQAQAVAGAKWTSLASRATSQVIRTTWAVP